MKGDSVIRIEIPLTHYVLQTPLRMSGDELGLSLELILNLLLSDGLPAHGAVSGTHNVKIFFFFTT